MISALKPTLFGLLTVGLVSACSHMATGTESNTQANKKVTESVDKGSEAAAIQPEPTDLTGESLFQLMLAEMSINRRDFVTAAVLYGEVGEKYNSVDALARAAALNQTIGQFEAMNRQALQWLSMRPDDENALQAVILSSVATGDTTQAVDSLTVWLKLNPNADVSILTPNIERLSAQQNQQLLSALDQLQSQYPKSASLYYTRSRLNYAAQNLDQAETLAQRSIDLDRNLAANLFYFQLLLEKDKTDQAKKVIKGLIKSYPDNIQVAVQYTRYLYRYEPDNLSELEILHNRFGRDPIIARTYARAAYDQQAYDAAQAVYLHLVELGYVDESHYFLGRIDIINELPDSAVEHFEKVQQPPFLISAMAEWVNLGRPEDEARLLAKLQESKEYYPASAADLWRLQASYYQLIKQPEQAWRTLEAAIDALPNNAGLLYDQAMLAANLQRYDVMEDNLTQVLQIEPDNIDAKNALGYTWVDLNKNLDLAIAYIEEALTAEPTNPAFQDSKGWYLYRLGKLDEALEWLTKAYAQMENDEVAAHIAEVLWRMDQQEEARTYLEEIRRLNPASRYLDYLNELFTQ